LQQTVRVKTVLMVKLQIQTASNAWTVYQTKLKFQINAKTAQLAKFQIVMGYPARLAHQISLYKTVPHVKIVQMEKFQQLIGQRAWLIKLTALHVL
jgi:hypothetical protein